jgi:hypothetical protein
MYAIIHSLITGALFRLNASDFSPDTTDWVYDNATTPTESGALISDSTPGTVSATMYGSGSIVIIPILCGPTITGTCNTSVVAGSELAEFEFNHANVDSTGGSNYLVYEMVQLGCEYDTITVISSATTSNGNLYPAIFRSRSSISQLFLGHSAGTLNYYDINFNSIMDACVSSLVDQGFPVQMIDGGYGITTGRVAKVVIDDIKRKIADWRLTTSQTRTSGLKIPKGSVFLKVTSDTPLDIGIDILYDVM